MEAEREEDIVSDMGCHFTWPELKRIDRMDLNRERKELEKMNVNVASLQTRTVSVMNLLGFIDYSLNEEQKGMDRFKDVLKMDPSNVNALSCLALIYRRHGLHTTYQEYASRLQEHLSTNNPRTLTRAFADGAFATKQFQQHDRRFTYMPYLVKAVGKANKIPDDVEKAEWHYEYALCLARKDAQHLMCKANPAQLESVLRDATLSFYKVTRLVDSGHPYSSLAWANLGNLLQRLPSRTFETILPNEISLHGTSAHDCFSKALEISPDNSEVLCIVGAAYSKEHRHNEALELLKRSLQLQETQCAYRCCGLIHLKKWEMKNSSSDHSESSVSASDTTGAVLPQNKMKNAMKGALGGGEVPTPVNDAQRQLRVKMPNLTVGSTQDNQRLHFDTTDRLETKNHMQDRSKVPVGELGTDSEWEHLSLEKTLLLQAKDSFLKAIHINATHADHSDLGYVLYLLGDFYRSIQYYNIATKCPDGDDFDTSLTHDRWAKCLEKLSEPRGARRQRDIQRQIKTKMREDGPDPDESWRYTHGVNCQGFECDITRFNYSSKERPGFVNILSEYNKTPTQTNMEFFATRYTGEFKYDFFISFAHIDYKWSVAFVYKLEKEFPGLRGRLRYRDYELGAAIADNIVSSVDDSYRTLIILSPDSLRDRWCRYEVQRAHMMNLTRPCAIPIMLRSCRIPTEIEHLSVVKCDQGQIKADDWHRLSKSLRQSDVDF